LSEFNKGYERGLEDAKTIVPTLRDEIVKELKDMRKTLKINIDNIDLYIEIFNKITFKGGDKSEKN